MGILKVFTDGGSRGNPGQAAIGIVAVDENNKIVYQLGQAIGVATNNEAEYQALITALKWLNINTSDSTSIHFFLDSLLVVSQMNGKFKIKSPTLRILWNKAKEEEKKLDCLATYTHIPREKNSLADSLLNSALDLLYPFAPNKK